MTDVTRRLILGVHVGAGRRVLNSPRLTLDNSLRSARLADDAGYDMLFRGDVVQFRKAAVNPTRPAFMLDPLVELTALATLTARIGIVITLSTTFNVPYILARQLQTLDHLSGGRIGWNAVTSFDGERHFGWDQMPTQTERYAQASEFLDLVHQLWASWGPEALALDEGGVLRADPARIADVDFEGAFYRSSGGFGLPRSPQGWPVQFQAGASEQGIAFAGRHAEAIYSASPTAAHAEGFYRAIHAAAAGPGGGRRAPLVLPGLKLSMAATRAGAEAKFAAATANINHRAVARALEGFLDGVSLEGLDLDQPIPLERFDTARSEGRRRISRHQIYRDAAASGLTLRRILENHVASSGHHYFVGSHDEVAAYIRDWFTHRRCDGFLLDFLSDNEELQAFTDHVLPQLADLRAVPDGPVTLRERLGLPLPDGATGR